MASGGGHWSKISKGSLAGRAVFVAQGKSKASAVAKVKAGKTSGMGVTQTAPTAAAKPAANAIPKKTAADLSVGNTVRLDAWGINTKANEGYSAVVVHKAPKGGDVVAFNKALNRYFVLDKSGRIIANFKRKAAAIAEANAPTAGDLGF